MLIVSLRRTILLNLRLLNYLILFNHKVLSLVDSASSPRTKSPYFKENPEMNNYH